MVSADERPSIFMVLIDDWGWANAGWHNNVTTSGQLEVQTPNLNRLVRGGIELNNHYTFKFCSPTRSALQSGRNPIHVNVQNVHMSYRNALDPVAGFSGIARNMTGIATVMQQAGYATAALGKWDVGMATPDHTPKGRGYEQSLVYFHHENDYWSHATTGPQQACQATFPGAREPATVVIRDLWAHTGPAKMYEPLDACQEQSPEKPWPVEEEACIYEDDLFEAEVTRVVREHDFDAKPLFLFWAPHNVHMPAQVPRAFYESLSFITETEPDGKGAKRQNYLARVKHMDASIGRLVDLLVAKGVWDNALIVLASDNGGPPSKANNWPLRGGKMSNFQGGVRVNACVGGGALPPAVRGSRLEELVTIWDWYATFAALAGVENVTDERAAAAGLPGLDSINQWPLLSGQVSEGPRSGVALGSCSDADSGEETLCLKKGFQPATVSAMVAWLGEERHLWKLLVGKQVLGGWTGQKNPTSRPPRMPIVDCGMPPAGSGCLFDLTMDPEERADLASDPRYEARRQQLLQLLRQHNATTHSPDRGTEDPAACTAATGRYGRYWGPWVDVATESETAAV